MIEARQIFKSFGKLQVLKGLDLTVEQGEVVSIMGPSGAGKSTFLQILGTIEQADNGMLTIGGTVVNKLSQKALARFRNDHIGFVFQFHHLFPEFTALENICIPAYIGGRSRKNATDQAMHLLKLLNLEQRADHKPAELSGGEQQRVAVARALVNNPTVILADEPSGNLDSNAAVELHRLFFELREQFNQTFVIVTHNPELAGMADRSYTLSDGNWQ
ncbi:MAG TPA: ABC transporter ATP-binding protein [Bacteroidales bacterium]|jgi:lipoprotein-releasing system ATP-binding protein|nr:ABC transporter ATP-binding protein [Bacteroidales bacterium]MDD4086574.1 ABC transporter ATP-binding protein [Bacteroidales bacterium]MDY0085335.1 ABC transporter ATP-binding protein [Bacteroidales bacterium]HPE44073.1 ABC transporter ATP-binding protein [Bacteroidales bacterium]